MELYYGFYAAFAGLLLDPAAGFRLPGAWGLLGLLAGLGKGVAGLCLRPLGGVLEAASQGLHGVGLLFLGKQGIQVRWPDIVVCVQDDTCKFCREAARGMDMGGANACWYEVFDQAGHLLEPEVPHVGR